MNPSSTIKKNRSKHHIENGRIDGSIAGKKTNGQEKRKPVSLKVLMYHRIVDDRKLSDECSYCVHKDDFRKQLELLSQMDFTPVTFRDYKLYTEGKILLPQKPVIITFDDGYLDTYEIAYPLLLEYGMRAVVFVLGDRNIATNIWDKGDRRIPVARLMQDHHITELHSKGFEIGAHSLTHANLLDLPEETRFKEIYESRQVLESILSNPVHCFSYPYGGVDHHIKKQAVKAGYEFACSVFSGPARFENDYLEIRRITIHNNTSVTGFVFRLKSPYPYLDWMWWKTKQTLKSNFSQ